jgi:hypothetical protein
MTQLTMSQSRENLAFKVIKKLSWHTHDGNKFKIYKDGEFDDEVDFNDKIRDLTKEEYNAVISDKYPLRIVANFDKRAWTQKYNKIIEFCDWTIELKPKTTIREMLDVIRKMPVYGYWECDPPKIFPRPKQYSFAPDDLFNEPKYMYIMELTMGT